MTDGFFHLAFIGPGGPEFLVVMLVLLLMFGAKDAPRIFRKLNEIFNQMRNTADGFRREIMYGDLNQESTSTPPPDEHEEDYDHGEDYDDYLDEEYDSDETFEELEKNLEEELKPTETAPEPEASENEDGDAEKT